MTEWRVNKDSHPRPLRAFLRAFAGICILPWLLNLVVIVGANSLSKEGEEHDLPPMNEEAWTANEEQLVVQADQVRQISDEIVGNSLEVF